MGITPEQLAAPDTEHAHQVALFAQAALHRKLWPELRWMYAVPNGGDRHIAVAGRLKAEGVKSGVSDLCLPVPRKGYHGFYIEMKKPAAIKHHNGGVSDNQKEFGEFVTQQGYLFKVCYSWIDAWDALLWYLD